jgi:hypothetical protein
MQQQIFSSFGSRVVTSIGDPTAWISSGSEHLNTALKNDSDSSSSSS